MAKLNATKRAKIEDDLRSGLKHVDVAAKHGVNPRTVSRIAKSLAPERPGNAILEQLELLSKAATEALESVSKTEASNEKARALKAATEALKTASQLRGLIEEEVGGGTREEVEAVTAVILDELKDLPDVRRKVARRLLDEHQKRHAA